MSLYLDTSALIKLYVEEPDSDTLWRAVGEQTLSTCRITWAEAHAGLARREREAPSPSAAWSLARERLAADWSAYLLIDVTQALVMKAGEYASVFALRGYDAVQLASGAALGSVVDEPSKFVSFDRRLNRAARMLGLTLPDGAPL